MIQFSSTNCYSCDRRDIVRFPMHLCANLVLNQNKCERHKWTLAADSWITSSIIFTSRKVEQRFCVTHWAFGHQSECGRRGASVCELIKTRNSCKLSSIWSVNSIKSIPNENIRSKITENKSELNLKLNLYRRVARHHSFGAKARRTIYTHIVCLYRTSFP